MWGKVADGAACGMPMWQVSRLKTPSADCRYCFMLQVVHKQVVLYHIGLCGMKKKKERKWMWFLCSPTWGCLDWWPTPLPPSLDYATPSEILLLQLESTLLPHFHRPFNASPLLTSWLTWWPELHPQSSLLKDEARQLSPKLTYPLHLSSFWVFAISPALRIHIASHPFVKCLHNLSNTAQPFPSGLCPGGGGKPKIIKAVKKNWSMCHHCHVFPPWLNVYCGLPPLNHVHKSTVCLCAPQFCFRSESINQHASSSNASNVLTLFDETRLLAVILGCSPCWTVSTAHPPCARKRDMHTCVQPLLQRRCSWAVQHWTFPHHT